ncbi:ribonucleoside-triphosphate reductase activating protein [Pyrococcus furiosus DSM 3638]|uniref:Ribonucleoside-triphosphate reductase activating protein n=3 Tax=Pyrococcus furiosus TaxID=2261 RepID=A0A5C0XRR6_PYRFU|nr:anaerobic ribonucleoside-triphosphate reductase activating protein [Pyrococcus furiosus]AAL82096.1 hypothetical protein PF1972 [Pyrococcus furiosus DSM 3638]AFN04669.1 anaerobic ribonucleoside-triphosphate reductase activating protein [Pyrococcus furiosus COM1]QEK79567.1 ribonucleoside-triphosphate reductase activating protein [Pyrococcus furiosus DSM 3638]
MLIGGWKAVSMVDIPGKVTFTLWLCGCNLRCPFCHNWKLAQGMECFKLEKEELIAEVEENSYLVDYFHVTGGEPLIQWREFQELLREVREYLPVSLNSNLTLVKPLEKIIDLVDHVATDLKAPPTELYGLPENVSLKLWQLFLKGLEIVSENSIPLELRIPVSKGFDIQEIMRWIEEGLEKIDTDFYVVLHPLVGPPITNPRNKEWCNNHCWADREIELIKEKLEERGVKKVIVRKYS